MPRDDTPSLHATDCTGVIKGNADIACERAMPDPDAHVPLPIYPAPADLPTR